MARRNRLLVVVDVQNDFVVGTLSTREALNIIEPLICYINNWDGHIVFTRDTHHKDYLATLEGKKIPKKHCMEGTYGWEIYPSVYDAAKEKTDFIFNKSSFGSIDFQNYLKNNRYNEVQFCGLCTDICVINNVMLALAAVPNTTIKVIEDLCAGVTVKSHQNAIEVMRNCTIDITSSISELCRGVDDYESKASDIRSIVVIYNKNNETITEEYNKFNEVINRCDRNQKGCYNIRAIFMYMHLIVNEHFDTFDSLIDYCQKKLSDYHLG